ncbi:HNH endonuclease signature motif containing protein [Phytohabitans flavus]|uniref:HNH endonuclease signature motif containing protein n=1 Tax=Phytohabitans flavus TaxID=1076124 RepID=UPI0036447DA2
MRSWADGGPTSLDNSVLLCGYHHRIIHRGHWTVRLCVEDSRPEFIPPAYVDQRQQPRRNLYYYHRT